VPTKLITQVTRRKIFDTITLSKEFWEGRLEEPDFLARIYDLDAADAPSSRTAGARAAARVGRDQVDVPEHPELTDDTAPIGVVNSVGTRELVQTATTGGGRHLAAIYCRIAMMRVTASAAI
jgi:hypothetical protein